MSQYVALPMSLEFRVDNDRHSINVVSRFGNGIKLPGKVKAVFAEDYESAKMGAVDNARAFVRTLAGVELWDFTLNVAVEEVEDGQFWHSGSCTTQVNL